MVWYGTVWYHTIPYTIPYHTSSQQREITSTTNAKKYSYLILLELILVRPSVRHEFLRWRCRRKKNFQIIPDLIARLESGKTNSASKQVHVTANCSCCKESWARKADALQVTPAQANSALRRTNGDAIRTVEIVPQEDVQVEKATED